MSRGTQIINNRILRDAVDPYDNTTVTIRNKRQATLLGGILGVIGGATLFGYLQSEKVQALEERIDDLEFRQDKIIHLLSAQSTDIAVNLENIKHLGVVLHEIMKVLTTNHATLKLEAGTFYIHNLVSQY